jgi:hypothetical protein
MAIKLIKNESLPVSVVCFVTKGKLSQMKWKAAASWSCTEFARKRASSGVINDNSISAVCSLLQVIHVDITNKVPS